MSPRVRRPVATDSAVGAGTDDATGGTTGQTGRRPGGWRIWARHSIPYIIIAAAGFTLAYLFTSTVIFPGGLVPDDSDVPDVVGVSYTEAVQRLSSYGFSPVRGETRYDQDAPSFTVIAQTPPAGTTLAKGEEIRLDVSRGQLRADVPMVVGLSHQIAQAQLEDAGFELGEVTSRESNAPRGQVVSSTPLGGQSVPLPAEVALTISSGPRTVELPDVTGQDYGQARSLLQQLGLTPSITWDSTSYMIENSVIGQTPVAGAQVTAGARIILTVAGRPQ